MSTRARRRAGTRGTFRGLGVEFVPHRCGWSTSTGFFIAVRVRTPRERPTGLARWLTRPMGGARRKVPVAGLCEACPVRVSRIRRTVPRQGPIGGAGHLRVLVAIHALRAAVLVQGISYCDEVVGKRRPHAQLHTSSFAMPASRAPIRPCLGPGVQSVNSPYRPLRSVAAKASLRATDAPHRRRHRAGRPDRPRRLLPRPDRHLHTRHLTGPVLPRPPSARGPCAGSSLPPGGGVGPPCTGRFPAPQHGGASDRAVRQSGGAPEPPLRAAGCA
jgi:hypothetical protein